MLPLEPIEVIYDDPVPPLKSFRLAPIPSWQYAKVISLILTVVILGVLLG